MKKLIVKEAVVIKRDDLKVCLEDVELEDYTSGKWTLNNFYYTHYLKYLSSHN